MNEENPVACQHGRSWEEHSGAGGKADVLVLNYTEKALQMEAYSICKYLWCEADMSLMGDCSILFNMAASVSVVSFKMASGILDLDF